MASPSSAPTPSKSDNTGGSPQTPSASASPTSKAPTHIVRVPADCKWDSAVTNMRQKTINEFIRSLGFYWGSLLENISMGSLLCVPGDCVLIDVYGNLELFNLLIRDQTEIVKKLVIYRRHQIVMTENAQPLLQYIIEKELRPLVRPYRYEMSANSESAESIRLQHPFPVSQTLIQIGLMRPKIYGTRRLPVQEILITSLTDEERERLLLQLYDRRHFGFKRIWRYIGMRQRAGATLSLYMEDIQLGGLGEYIRSQSCAPNQKEVFLNIYVYKIKLGRFAFETIDALRYLEKHNFVHRRLSIDCLLLTGAKRIKLAIYGLTLGELFPTKPDFDEIDRARWAAIECLAADRIPADGPVKQYTMQSVVFTFGTILWSIYHQASLPYENETVAEIMSFTYRREVPLEIVPGLMPEPIENVRKNELSHYLKILYSCWELAEDTRPRFKTLKQQFKAALKEVYKPQAP